MLAIGTVPASAHAGLLGTDPEDGAVLDHLPDQVTFTFNEVVGRPAVAVVAPDGSAVPVSDVSAVDRTVTARLDDVDQRGVYTASYRVVSADGHPVSSSITFEVTTGRVVEQKPPATREGFVHRHRTHLIWGGLATVIAVLLLIAPWRRGDDQDDA